MRTWWRLLALGAGLGSCCALADRLTIIPETGTAGVGDAAGPFVLERRSDTGGTPTDLAAVTATLTAEGTSQLATSAFVYGDWAPTRSVTLAAGETRSAPFFFRSPGVGTRSITGTAGALSVDAARVTSRPLSLEDTAESGNLLLEDSPPGPWLNRSLGAEGSNPFSAEGAAAHRGTYGLRLDDVDSSTGSGSQNRLATARGPLESSEFYLRFWLRVSPVSTGGQMIIAQVLWDLGVPHAPLNLRLTYPQARLSVAASDINGISRTGAQEAPAAHGQWQLVELALRGIGTATGALSLWVDGQGVTTVSSVDWTSRQASRVQLGSIYASDRTFTGFLDFDDLRASVTPPAGRLGVTSDVSAMKAGDCAPLVTRLTAPEGDAAPAPYPVALAGSVEGLAGTFHTDPACESAPGAGQIAEGATEAGFYFRPSEAGLARVSASHVDFLAVGGPVPLDVQALASAPVPAPPALDSRTFRVGCETGAASSLNAAFILLAGLTLVVRSRGQPRRGVGVCLDCPALGPR